MYLHFSLPADTLYPEIIVQTTFQYCQNRGIDGGDEEILEIKYTPDRYYNGERRKCDCGNDRAAF